MKLDAIVAYVPGENYSLDLGHMTHMYKYQIKGLIHFQKRPLMVNKRNEYNVWNYDVSR